jgi:hypothetical protein
MRLTFFVNMDFTLVTFPLGHVPNTVSDLIPQRLYPNALFHFTDSSTIRLRIPCHHSIAFNTPRSDSALQRGCCRVHFCDWGSGRNRSDDVDGRLSTHLGDKPHLNRLYASLAHARHVEQSAAQVVQVDLSHHPGCYDCDSALLGPAQE